MEDFYHDDSPVPVIKCLDDLVEELHKVFAYDRVNVTYVKSLMSAYKSNPIDWKKYAKFDPLRYTRNLVDTGNGKFNLIALCWGEGHGSSIHDHSRADCFVKILSGSLKETMFQWPEETLNERDEEGGEEGLSVDSVGGSANGGVVVGGSADGVVGVGLTNGLVGNGSSNGAVGKRSVNGIVGSGSSNRIIGNESAEGFVGNLSSNGVILGGSADRVVGGGRTIGIYGNGSVNGLVGSGSSTVIVENGSADGLVGNGSSNGVVGNGSVDGIVGSGSSNGAVVNGSANGVAGSGSSNGVSGGRCSNGGLAGSGSAKAVVEDEDKRSKKGSNRANQREYGRSKRRLRQFCSSDSSAGGSGSIYDHQNHLGDQRMVAIGSNVYFTDQVTYICDQMGLHRVENPSHTEKAISLHLYCPPFEFCHVFDERSGKTNVAKMTFWSKYGERTPFTVSHVNKRGIIEEAKDPEVCCQGVKEDLVKEIASIAIK